jgi:hypothetical protein
MYVAFLCSKKDIQIKSQLKVPRQQISCIPRYAGILTSSEVVKLPKQSFAMGYALLFERLLRASQGLCGGKDCFA